jgi:ribosomal protein L11 methyltransferase
MQESNMKRYKDFLITAEPFNPEILTGILWELDIEGLVEDVNCVHVYVNGNSDTGIDNVKEELEKLKEQKLLFNYTVEETPIQDRNWNEEWEKTINIIKVSGKIVIKPTFREYQKSGDEIVITIDPKMSFGTGEHQTTKLVLTLLEKYVSAGQRMLDVGSGTGVLAIAALKLGASSAIAVDNDEWCFDNAKENAQLNNVSGTLDVRTGVIDDVKETGFDLITANIQKNILIEICEAIKQKVKPGGYIILSGLLDIDEEDINKHYSNAGLKFIEKSRMDEWISMVFQK